MALLRRRRLICARDRHVLHHSPPAEYSNNVPWQRALSAIAAHLPRRRYGPEPPFATPPGQGRLSIESAVDNADRSPAQSRHAAREILLYGACGGLLILALRFVEYRFLVVEHSVEIYGSLVAALFAGLGVWLGLTLTRKKPMVGGPQLPVAGPALPFVVNDTRVQELGLTPRELEILGLIADGLSNREIAGKLFISENTVKTHSGRVFDKLGARRRTQAVQIGKAAGLIP